MSNDWIGRWTIQRLDRGNGAGMEEIVTFWLAMTDPVIATLGDVVPARLPDWLLYIRLNRVYALKEWSRLWLNGAEGECLCLVYQCVTDVSASPRQRLVMAAVAHLFQNGVGAESVMRALIHGGMRLWPPPPWPPNLPPPPSAAPRRPPPERGGDEERRPPVRQGFAELLEQIRGPPTALTFPLSVQA